MIELKAQTWWHENYLFYPDLTMSDVTRILSSIESGDLSAAEQLLPLVYDELRKLAVAKLAQEKPGQTLQATALVHEAYLRLGGPFENSRHFFGAAAEAMRRILVDNARRKMREKHGGKFQRVELTADAFVEPAGDERLLALDEALQRFAVDAPEKAELLKLRWFGGLSSDEAAATLGISPSTADRWWSYARAWLKVEVDRENFSESRGAR
jgi:RNA polymerase sigma factor (TIGR02999 family)